MRRLLPFLVFVLVAAAACGGTEVAAPPASPTSSPSPAPQPSGTVTPESTGTASPSAPAGPRPIPPAWAEPIEDDLDPDDLPSGELVPPGARPTARATLRAAGGVPDGVAVAYAIGDDPFSSEHGFALWQRFDEPPAWSVVFAFVDPPQEGVLGIRLETGDLTGDGHWEVLSFEDRGGTGACGTWRVIAPAPGDARPILDETTCDTEIRIADGRLEVREAVYGPDDPHCCPRAFRTTVLAWDGSRFERVSSRTDPAGP